MMITQVLNDEYNNCAIKYVIVRYHLVRTTTPRFSSCRKTSLIGREKRTESWHPRWAGSAGVMISTYGLPVAMVSAGFGK